MPTRSSLAPHSRKFWKAARCLGGSQQLAWPSSWSRWRCDWLLWEQVNRRGECVELTVVPKNDWHYRYGNIDWESSRLEKEIVKNYWGWKIVQKIYHKMRAWGDEELASWGARSILIRVFFVCFWLKFAEFLYFVWSSGRKLREVLEERDRALKSVLGRVGTYSTLVSLELVYLHWASKH